MTRRSPPVCIALALVVLLALAACDATSDGRSAYDEGRYEDALRLFDEAAAAAGDDASPELLYDVALAAVQVGEYRRAEAAAEACAAKGGSEVAALGAFVRGNAAWARSEVAEAESLRPGGDATAHEWAMASTEDALAAWRFAAASRVDWPEARRNVERALLRLERLRERRTEGGRPRPDQPPPPPTPPPLEPPPPDPAALDPAATETTELPPERVLALFQVLLEKERQKIALRRAQRQARSSDVEKDW